MKKMLGTTLVGIMAVSAVAGCSTDQASPKSGNAAKSNEKPKFSMSMATSGNKYAEKSGDINKENGSTSLKSLPKWISIFE